MLVKKIRSRLHILMGERRIKSIRELSKLTGLSRNTLTKIYNDENDRIDYNTIIVLCDFFEVPLGRFLELIENEQEQPEINSKHVHESFRNIT